MEARVTRRAFLAACAAVRGLAAGAADRLGIMCQLPPEEAAAREVLASARKAGFRHSQISFPWDRTPAAFLHALPKWVAAADLRADVLSAYVNCAAPGKVIMNTRAEDFDRAIELAPELGAARLIAWTGGYGDGLMSAHPKNSEPGAADAIVRFLDPRLKRLEANRLVLALESYITLACPDAPSLRRLLDRLPGSVTAVLDPPNLTPIAKYSERDQVMRAMFRVLAGRIGVVHLKDFRMAADGRSYELPGPLAGEVNYSLFAQLIQRLPGDIPVVAEHLSPAEFAPALAKLARLFGSDR
jgi:sugar phosphate isomerase/epimerase